MSCDLQAASVASVDVVGITGLTGGASVRAMRALRAGVVLTVAVGLAGATVSVAPAASRVVALRSDRCLTPLTYDVVRVDPGFRVTRAAFVALLQRSERIWEAPVGSDLLRYEPGGAVKVSLVYDQRQVHEAELAAADAALARSRAALAREKADLARRHNLLDARRAKLTARIAYWDARGGATEAAYAALKTEQRAINALVDDFNARTSAYNGRVAAFNADVAARNTLAQPRTSDDEVLGTAEVGGRVLSIFVLSGTAKDESLVAHEFGHIFGIEHVAGASNVMNPVRVQTLLRASAADLAALRAACAAG